MSYFLQFATCTCNVLLGFWWYKFWSHLNFTFHNMISQNGRLNSFVTVGVKTSTLQEGLQPLLLLGKCPTRSVLLSFLFLAFCFFFIQQHRIEGTGGKLPGLGTKVRNATGKWCFNSTVVSIPSFCLLGFKVIEMEVGFSVVFGACDTIHHIKNLQTTDSTFRRSVIKSLAVRRNVEGLLGLYNVQC